MVIMLDFLSVFNLRYNRLLSLGILTFSNYYIYFSSVDVNIFGQYPSDAVLFAV